MNNIPVLLLGCCSCSDLLLLSGFYLNHIPCTGMLVSLSHGRRPGMLVSLSHGRRPGMLVSLSHGRRPAQHPCANKSGPVSDYITFISLCIDNV